MGMLKKALSLLSAIFLAVGLIGCQTEVPSSVGIDANGDGVVDCQVAVATSDSSVTLTAGEGCQDTAATPATATPEEPTPPPATVSDANKKTFGFVVVDATTLKVEGLDAAVKDPAAFQYDLSAKGVTITEVAVSDDMCGWGAESTCRFTVTNGEAILTLSAEQMAQLSGDYGKSSTELALIGTYADGTAFVAYFAHDPKTPWGPLVKVPSSGDDSGNGNVAATFIMNGNGVGEYSTYFTVTVTDAEGLLGALNAPLPECDALDVRLGFLNFNGPVGGNAVVPGWDDEVSAVIFNGPGQYIIPGIPSDFRGEFVMYCATKVSAATWRDDIRYIITNDPAIAISGPRVVEDPNSPGSFIIELADNTI